MSIEIVRIKRSAELSVVNCKERRNMKPYYFSKIQKYATLLTCRDRTQVHNLFFTFLVDGDLITIFDSSDLSFAIQCSRILKITLFGKNFNACKVDIMLLRVAIAPIHPNR